MNVVIPQHRLNRVPLLKHPPRHLLGGRAPVNQISQQHDGVGALPVINRAQELLKGLKAPLNIPNGIPGHGLTSAKERQTPRFNTRTSH